MKYCEPIQDLAGRGHNWKFYDENFHFLRQTHHSALPWDRIHNELWLKSHQVNLPKSLQPLSTGRLSGKADTTPKGYCFRFHKGRKCALGCGYKHLCYKCEGSHPVSNVIFVAQPKHPVFSPNLPSPSPHKLLTPVKVERLRLLLDGYTPSTVEFLNRVLLVAFHFTFKVSPNRAEQIICCQPLRILWQLT